MNQNTAVRRLAALRLVVGAAAYLTPRLAGRGFMLDPDANPQSPYLARLFGIRDVALAYGSTQAGGEARRTWLVAGLMCDAADTVSALAGGRAGYLTRTQTVLLALPAIAATAIGAAALSGADSPAEPDV